MKSIAPHLEAYLDNFDQGINELISMETEAINEKNYKGVNDKNYPVLSTINNEKSEPVFYKEIEEIIGEDIQLKDLFKSIVE